MWCMSPRPGPSSAWADANLEWKGWRRLLPFSNAQFLLTLGLSQSHHGWSHHQLTCRDQPQTRIWGLAGHQPTLIAQQEPSQGILLGREKALMLGEQIPLAA